MSVSLSSISFLSPGFGLCCLFNIYAIRSSAVAISCLILFLSLSNSAGVKISLVGDCTSSPACVLRLRKKFGILFITYISESDLKRKSPFDNSS